MPFLSGRSCGRSCGSFVSGIHEKCPDLSSGACRDGSTASTPWSFLRLVVSDVVAWYGFFEGDALRFRFLFASEPVEDFLSAFFPFEFKYSTFYSAEHGSYPCRLVFTHFAFLIARRDFEFLRAVLPLEIWPETPILPKPLFSWRRLPM